MNAIVSGSLGAAILVDEQTLLWLDEDADAPVPCTPRELRRVAFGTPDATYFQGIDQPTARTILHRASALYAALTRLSIAVANRSTPQERLRSLSALDELINDEDIDDDVLNVAFSMPPEELGPALEMARRERLPGAITVLEEIHSSRDAIASVREAWDVAIAGHPDANRVRSWAIRSGLFRTMVDAVIERAPILTVHELLETRRGPSLRDVSVADQSVSDVLGRWTSEVLKRVGGSVGEWRRRAADRFRALAQAIGFDSGSIQILDGDERALFVSDGFVESPNSRALLASISHDKLMARVVAGRQALFIPAVSRDPDWTPTRETADVVSWVGAPLIYQGRIVVGLLTIDFKRPIASIAPFQAMLDSFSVEMAELLWMTGPLYRQRRAEHAMRTLRRTINIISAKHNPHDLLHTIVDEVALNLKCSHCTIFLPEGRGAERQLVASYSFGVPADAKPARFKLKEGLVGHVFDSGRTIVLGNAAVDDAFVPGRNPSATARSMVLAPIKVADQNVGVICADRDTIGWFQKSDGQFLEMLSLQAGLAIQRASALDFLESIAQKMLSLHDVKEILWTVLQKAIDLVNATTGVIYLVNAQTRPITITLKVEFDDFVHPAPRIDGITRTVVETREIVAIPDTEKDESINQSLRHFKAMIAVPLKVGLEVIGVLFVDDEDRHVFSDVEKHLLMVLASQSAIAIQKASEIRRSNELERQLSELNQLVEARSVQHVLDKIGEGICAIFEGVSPTINLYDSSKREFVRYCAYGPLKDRLGAPPRPDGFAAYVIRERKPLYLSDINRRQGGVPGLRREHRELRIVSLAAIPLEVHGEALGVLFVNSQSTMAFTPADQRKLELLARQAAVAITYARVCEEITREEGVPAEAPAAPQRPV